MRRINKMTYDELLADRDYYLEESRIAHDKLVQQDVVIYDLYLSFNKIPVWVQKNLWSMKKPIRMDFTVHTLDESSFIDLNRYATALEAYTAELEVINRELVDIIDAQNEFL